jgi:hypothetical protein
MANVTLTGNDALVSAEFDHTTGLNYNGAATADTEDATVIITDNLAMTSLTFGANNVNSLTVTGNDALTTVDFTGLASVGNDADGTPTVNIWDNDFSASALDTVDGLITATQEEVDGTTGSGAGTNDDADDLGSYTTTSGMSTLSTYLTAVKATARATAAVNFDTVTAYTIAENAAASGQTAGVQNSGNQLTWATDGGGTSDPDALWIGLVYADTVGTYASTTSNPTAIPEQALTRAFVLDNTDLAGATTTINLKVGGVDVLHTGSAYGSPAIVSTSNLDLQIGALKTTAAASRAADLGVSFDVYKGANSTLPAVVFKTGSTSATNYEAYTDAELAALYGGDGTMTALVTTYDVFTMTVGGLAVTASITLGSGVTSASGATANAAIASAIASAWNTKYGASGTSAALNFWGDANADTTSGTIASLAQRSEQSGSRPYGQTIAIAHTTKTTAAQMSTISAGAATNVFSDWLIGATQSTADNDTTAADVIIAVTEVTEGVIDGTGTSANQMTVSLGGTNITLVELATVKTYNGTKSETTNATIYYDDAGMYGAIAGGGVGDSRDDQTVDEGLEVTTTSGAQRGLITRLHWLGS